jgi:hypothetical protein
MDMVGCESKAWLETREGLSGLFTWRRWTKIEWVGSAIGESASEEAASGGENSLNPQVT